MGRNSWSLARLISEFRPHQGVVCTGSQVNIIGKNTSKSLILGTSLTSRVWRFHLSVILFGSCDVDNKVSAGSVSTVWHFLEPECRYTHSSLWLPCFTWGQLTRVKTLMLISDVLLVTMLLHCVYEFIVLLW